MKKLLLRINNDFLYDDLAAASVRYGKSVNEFLNLCLEFSNQDQVALSEFLVMKIRGAADEAVTSLDSHRRACHAEQLPFTGRNPPPTSGGSEATTFLSEKQPDEHKAPEMKKPTSFFVSGQKKH